ncbi:hypothetical protein ANN_20880 [Periplaneta americana]|uniref:Uncharacterized protein n=1 Tax=Periplaneta americana TaxID=6978 RepID=A0ABQ8SEA2_PERAM|nr:hypothetical protein ANN_20880 [Periplaneta americana]
MAGLCEDGNKPPGSLKAMKIFVRSLRRGFGMSSPTVSLSENLKCDLVRKLTRLKAVPARHYYRVFLNFCTSGANCRRECRGKGNCRSRRRSGLLGDLLYWTPPRPRSSCKDPVTVTTGYNPI